MIIQLFFDTVKRIAYCLFINNVASCFSNLMPNRFIACLHFLIGIVNFLIACLRREINHLKPIGHARNLYLVIAARNLISPVFIPLVSSLPKAFNFFSCVLCISPFFQVKFLLNSYTICFTASIIK